MQQPDGKPDPARWPWGRALLGAALLAVIGAAVVRIVSVWPSSIDEPPAPPGLTPEQIRAALSHPRDSAPVIGVSAGGRHRAYLLQTFLQPEARITNDLLGAVPVTVTYCDLSDCVRVFIGESQGRPLRVAIGGWVRGRPKSMLLRVGSNMYWQDTGLPLDETTAPFPYPRLDFLRTTWGQWREAHPDTDAYIGKVPFPSADETTKVVIPAGTTAGP
jgi:hypothetical protein